MCCRKHQLSVHPRPCGEQSNASICTGARGGSSPPVRGTGFRVRGVARGCRFIPARAGNRGTQRRFRIDTPVHPRPCGEQHSLHPWAKYSFGSSPPVRGTEAQFYRYRDFFRFIPARAGNSNCLPVMVIIISVHPRPCGEQSYDCRFCPVSTGSSPPVRGTDHQRSAPALLCRFIPARAGNSHASGPKYRRAAVHPRPCGEQVRRGCGIYTLVGSSPPVRGTADGNTAAVSDRRFIPARAGNSNGLLLRKVYETVHPRPCGEQLNLFDGHFSSSGSSPPVRGTVLLSGASFTLLRFIPARAGNSRPLTETLCLIPVHPRPCGEQVLQTKHKIKICGSSPPVRGTDANIGREHIDDRFIPARAGNRLLLLHQNN